MKERRVSHVPGIDLATWRAGGRWPAPVAAEDLDLIVHGSCTFDEQVPNSASACR